MSPQRSSASSTTPRQGLTIAPFLFNSSTFKGYIKRDQGQKGYSELKKDRCKTLLRGLRAQGS